MGNNNIMTLTPDMCFAKYFSVFVLALTALCATCVRAEAVEPAIDQQCQMLIDGSETSPDRVPINAIVHLEQLPERIRIRRIIYSKRDVFDENNPDEDRYLYRLANRLHFNTTTEVVRRQLLVEEGDEYSQRHIDESERLLRANSYFADARVIPYQRCGDEIDVLVITRDVWTTYPVIYFSISGGDNTRGAGFSDGNFLGMGNRVSIAYKTNNERNSYILGFKDGQIAGSRYDGDFQLTESSDGQSRSASLERPFYSLDAQWANGMTASQDVADDTYYYNGRKVDKFEHHNDTGSAYYGRLLHRDGNTVRRWLVGVEGDRHRFDPIDYAGGFPDVTPENREYRYPWIGYQYEDEHYGEFYNLFLIHRTEDVFLGQRSSIRVGYASKQYNSTDSAWMIDLNYLNTVSQGKHHYFQHAFSINGYWLDAQHEFENLVIDYQVQYTHKEAVNLSNYVSLSFTAGKNLTADRQLSGGGDDNLRGYPGNIQTGDRRFLMTAERRYYYDWHVFNLFRFGSAVFFDAGQVWRESDNSQLRDSRTVLADVGFGLRINSSKASSGSVLHIDLAFPLTARDHSEVDSMEWRISGKSSF